jgi:hypothetical protein
VKRSGYDRIFCPDQDGGVIPLNLKDRLAMRTNYEIIIFQFQIFGQMDIFLTGNTLDSRHFSLLGAFGMN